MLASSDYPALLLNADYRPVRYHPLRLASWKRVLRGTFCPPKEQKFTVVSYYDRVLRSQGSAAHARVPTEYRMPSVVALLRYEQVNRPAAFTRMGVLVRDRYRCAYCGERFPSSQLTFDHVVPRSRGGRTSWLNIVSACEGDNMRKGNKLLSESGMKLRITPKIPTRHELNEIGREFPPPIENLHRSWLPWLGLEDTELAGTNRAKSWNGSEVFPPGMTQEEYWNAELDE
jgi:5-methylcytosine-specific restriction endonuclease McrA